MISAQDEEFLHFAMDLAFLTRHTPKWKAALQRMLFKEGDLVENQEQGEDEREQ
ncbi:MAG TPA: hypothetical protein VGP82_07385 [Ktedonobacterales bacterium]|jgi:hypothetical protein|nr:hypothetical protein [Ktedonobacterales bacterium]